MKLHNWPIFFKVMLNRVKYAQLDLGIDLERTNPFSLRICKPTMINTAGSFHEGTRSFINWYALAQAFTTGKLQATIGPAITLGLDRCKQLHAILNPARIMQQQIGISHLTLNLDCWTTVTDLGILQRYNSKYNNTGTWHQTFGLQ